MPALARADLESLLRARKLDRTLIYGHSPEVGRDLTSRLSTGLPALDAELDGGLARGELSEIVGPRSSGRTTLGCGLLAAAVAAGEVAALVDALDRFDPPSAAAAGLALDRLLWVRGHAHVEAALDRAVKAFSLVLQAGGFAVAVLDLADVPLPALRRLPFTTWRRLSRIVEGGRTAAVLVAAEHLARSPGGATIALGGPSPRWKGSSARARLLDGLVLRPRRSSP
jgi:hypothetical protein